MGRRTSLAALAGAPVEDVPGKSAPILLSLPLDRLHCTRFNPRRNFGTEDDLREFGEKLKREQLQPAVVVSRAGYLKLWPDEAERVGTATYVVANGERRYRASQLVGRPVLEVVHREDVAASRASFLDAVQSENNDRQNLDPIERAIAIETMVTELGGANQVAAYYSKTAGWVSQQRKLLKLIPELQDLVSAGEMPVRVARDIAGLPQDTQAAAWQEQVERRRLEKEAGARLRAAAANPSAPPASAAPPRPASAVAPRPEPTVFTAVKRDSEPAHTKAPEETTEPARFTAVNTPPAPVPDPSSRPVPAQATEPADRQPVKFPYEDAVQAFQFLIRKAPVEQLDQLTDMLVDYRAQRAVTAP